MNKKDELVIVMSAEIVMFPGKYIDVSELSSNTRKLRSGLISTDIVLDKRELAEDHTSEPIKDINDIRRIKEYLLSNNRYRDNMLFILGINLGLRVSDLRSLRFSDLINQDLTFKDTFPVFEIKTRNTRKNKKNRYLTINDAIVEAVTIYLENTDNVTLNDYLFRSMSNRGASKNEPLHRNNIDRIIKGIAKDVGLTVKVSTHTLRKTFAYHQMLASNNDPRKLLLLQKILGHSSVAQTMEYIGITDEEIHDAYMSLNLGLSDYDITFNCVEAAS